MPAHPALSQRNATTGGDKRRDPRYEVFANVRVRSRADLGLLSVRNLSLGGMFLEMAPERRGHFRPGSIHDLVLFDAAQPHRPPLRAQGEVMRHDDDGVALRWTEATPDLARQLTHFLEALAPTGAP